MTLIEQLTTVAEAFGQARKLSTSRVSTLAFGDGTKLPAILAGADLTTSRFEHAMRFFSDHWPDGVEWPAQIARPPAKAEAA